MPSSGSENKQNGVSKGSPLLLHNTNWGASGPAWIKAAMQQHAAEIGRTYIDVLKDACTAWLKANCPDKVKDYVKD